MDLNSIGVRSTGRGAGNAAGSVKGRVIIFAPPEGEDGRKLKKALRRAGAEVTLPVPDEYGAALGQFAGVRGIPAPELPEDIREKAMTALSLRPTYPELPDTFILFAFQDEKALEQALEAVKNCGAGPFPYKAVLTPTNMTWSVYECFRNIREEHEQITSAAEE